jgi:hypothetical protein
MQLISKKIDVNVKPSARWGHSACVVKGHFVIFGGNTGSGGAVRDVNIFSLQGHSFILIIFCNFFLKIF